MRARNRVETDLWRNSRLCLADCACSHSFHSLFGQQTGGSVTIGIISFTNRNLWEVRLICQIMAVAVSIVILVDLKQSKIVRDATCIRDSHFGALVRFMHVLQAKFYLIVESVVISLVKN